MTDVHDETSPQGVGDEDRGSQRQVDAEPLTVKAKVSGNGHPTGVWQAGDGKWYPAPAPPGFWQASDGNWYPQTQQSSNASPPLEVSVRSNGMATAAMVLGILGVLIGLVPLFFFGAWLFGVLALTFGVAGRRKAKRLPVPLNKVRATSGVVLGCVALVLGGIGVVIIDDAVDDISRDAERFGRGTAENPAIDDVSLTGCEAGDFGSVDVTGMITNHSSERSNYVVSVNILDDAGIKVGDATTFENNISAGQDARWEASGFPAASATGALFTCEVVDVTRLSAE